MSLNEIEFRAADQLKNDIKNRISSYKSTKKIISYQTFELQIKSTIVDHNPELRVINQLKINKISEFEAANQLK